MTSYNIHIKRGLLLFGFMLSCVILMGQARFYAKGNDVAYTGEYYQISFVLENIEGENFTPPDFSGFEVASGPNQSSSYQWINGKTTTSVAVSYFLLPLDTGLLTIGSARIKVDDKTFLTEEIQIEVKKGEGGTDTQVSEETAMVSGWEEQAAKGIFMRLFTDNQTPYVGEQIVVQAKLYQKIDAYGTQIVDFPEFDGFWKQDISSDNSDWKQEKYDGEYYHTVSAGKFVLFPQKDGQFTIEPYTLTTVIEVPSEGSEGDFWSQFFQEYEEVEYEFSSNSLVIDVKNLPEENKPEDFNGAVGNYDFGATIDSTHIQLGSPIKLEYKIKGTGNIMMVNLPDIEFPKNIGVYDPVIDETISERSTYVNGKKDYEYILVPELPGKYTIPATSFSYFNPTDNQYYTNKTDSFVIEVEGEMPQAYLDSIEKQEIVLEEGELYNNRAGLNYKEMGAKYFGSTLFYVFASTPPLLFILFLFFRKRMENYTPDIAALKYKKAQKQAAKQLKKAKEYMQEGNKEKFYNEVIRALWAYSADKLNIDTTHLTKDNIARKLNEVGVSEINQTEMKSVLEKCEFALFATAAQSEMEEDYKAANEIIVNIENEINA